MKRIVRGVGHEAGGEIRALLAGIDHRHGEVRVDGAARTGAAATAVASPTASQTTADE